MRERFGFTEGLCPVAEETASRTMALPFFTQIDPGDQERVVDVRRAAVATGADNPAVADAARMIFLAFGNYARAAKINALEPLPEGDRAHGGRRRARIE